MPPRSKTNATDLLPTVKVLTPHETIHLIPESEMLVRDTKSFPDYAYCPINESRLHPKNAKIQFVAIVLTRPVVSADQKLTWSVADRTGVVSRIHSPLIRSIT